MCVNESDTYCDANDGIDHGSARERARDIEYQQDQREELWAQSISSGPHVVVYGCIQRTMSSRYNSSSPSWIVPPGSVRSTAIRAYVSVLAYEDALALSNKPHSLTHSLTLTLLLLLLLL